MFSHTCVSCQLNPGIFLLEGHDAVRPLDHGLYLLPWLVLQTHAEVIPRIGRSPTRNTNQNVCLNAKDLQKDRLWSGGAFNDHTSTNSTVPEQPSFPCSLRTSQSDLANANLNLTTWSIFGNKWSGQKSSNTTWKYMMMEVMTQLMTETYFNSKHNYLFYSLIVLPNLELSFSRKCDKLNI